MSKAISEETIQKIIQFYEQGNMSDGMIAQAVGVSERTVRRYGKSVGLGQALPDTTRKASPAVVRPSPLPDQALDVTERPRPAVPDSTAGQYRTVLPDNRKRWLCKRCGHITDKKSKTVCPNCWRGPFATFCVEIGSPEYEQLIEEHPELETTKEHENEEVCDTTKDYWICQDCDYCSNNEFKICPECKSRAVESAPQGLETRDPSKYKDPEPQDNEESGDENETDAAITREEKQQEYEWKCPKCGFEWDGSPDKCPRCGIELQE
jgi:predicted Zn-ribbon and HTH transcriptional regulator